eukprot:5040391-Amphidinium_carterae.1
MLRPKASLLKPKASAPDPVNSKPKASAPDSVNSKQPRVPPPPPPPPPHRVQQQFGSGREWQPNKPVAQGQLWAHQEARQKNQKLWVQDLKA